MAALPPTCVGAPEAHRGSASASQLGPTKGPPPPPGVSTAAGSSGLETCGEAALLVPWDGTRPLAGSRLWTPYLLAPCQPASLEVREVSLDI